APPHPPFSPTRRSSDLLVTLACMLGQIGLPGGGFGASYGPTNITGSSGPLYSGPTLPQGTNPVKEFIPVARFTDMLLHPGQSFRSEEHTSELQSLTNLL